MDIFYQVTEDSIIEDSLPTYHTRYYHRNKTEQNERQWKKKSHPNKYGDWHCFSDEKIMKQTLYLIK